MNELLSKLPGTPPATLRAPACNRARAGARRIRVMVVDDDPDLREALALHLNQKPDLAVCGEAESEPQALERIPVLKPDLAVVKIPPHISICVEGSYEPSSIELLFIRGSSLAEAWKDRRLIADGS